MKQCIVKKWPVKFLSMKEDGEAMHCEEMDCEFFSIKEDSKAMHCEEMDFEGFFQ